LRLADIGGLAQRSTFCVNMLDLGGFFHHTCFLWHNIFWSSAINLGLTVTTNGSEVGEGAYEDGRQMEPR
jgi:hypothetical protein